MPPSTLLKTLASTWPAWVGTDITLYHGTTLTSAEKIVSMGVDLGRCRPNTDFGRGFYTTTWLDQAEAWAHEKARRRDSAPAVVKFTLNREELGKLQTIAFVRGSVTAEDFWSFVFHCRLGFSHMPNNRAYYDVAYGPVARSWNGPERSRLREGFDQISFHTTEGSNLLGDRSRCDVEVL